MNISVYRRESIQQLVMGNAFPHDNKDCIVTTDSSQYLKIIFIINQNGHGFRVIREEFSSRQYFLKNQCLKWRPSRWRRLFIGLFILNTVRDNIYVTFIFMRYFSYSHEFKIA